jgi:hypothetical protein
MTDALGREAMTIIRGRAKCASLKYAAGTVPPSFNLTIPVNVLCAVNLI